MAHERSAVHGKHEVTRLLNRLIEDDGFARDDFIIAGSARMLMTGHRDRISDIDIVARGKTWHRAVELVSLGRGYTEFTAISGAMVVRLYEGLVEVCDTWFMGEVDTDGLIEGADLIGGLRYITHADLVAYKRKLNRPKDRRDLVALGGGGPVTPVPDSQASTGRRPEGIGARTDSGPMSEHPQRADSGILLGTQQKELDVNMGEPTPDELRLATEETHRAVDHARAMLTHADTKAALLAAGAVPIAALLLAAPSMGDRSGFHTGVSWFAIAFMLSGIGCLGMVVWPRLSGTSGIKTGAQRPPEQIVERSLRVTSSPESRLEDAARELALLSTLAYRKFRRIQAAMSCFGVAGVFMVVAAAV